MWPDWVSNPGPLALESDVIPAVLLSRAGRGSYYQCMLYTCIQFTCYWCIRVTIEVRNLT